MPQLQQKQKSKRNLEDGGVKLPNFEWKQTLTLAFLPLVEYNKQFVLATNRWPISNSGRISNKANTFEV